MQQFIAWIGWQWSLFVAEFVGSKLCWLVWDLTGARAVYRMIRPHTAAEKAAAGFRAPSIIMLSLFSLYGVIYAYADTAYDRAVNRQMAKYTTLVTQASSNDLAVMRAALYRIPELQQALVPVEPHLHTPFSVLRSFWGEQATYPTMLTLTKEVVEGLKGKLAGVNMYRVDLSDVNLDRSDLSGADLFEAILKRTLLQESNLTDVNLYRADLSGTSLFLTNLREANLNDVNLSRAHIGKADLYKASLDNANLSRANLLKANLNRASLRDANLSWANLWKAELNRADLSKANLWQAKLNDATLTNVHGLTLEQLLSVKTLYGVIGLDPELAAAVRAQKPELFEASSAEEAEIETDQ